MVKKSDIEVLRYRPIKNVKDFFKNIGSLFRYFTIWILIIDILYLTGVLKGIEFFLITIHIFIIIFCAYIFYFKFKKFKTRTYSLNLLLRGNILFLIDFIFHYVPLILIIKFIQCRKLQIKADKMNIIFCLIIPGLYFLLKDTYTIYFLRESKSFTIYILFLIIIFVSYFSLKK